MGRELRVTAVQPPALHAKIKNVNIISKGLELLEKAGRISSDIACLPEYFNVFGLSPDDSKRKAKSQHQLVLQQIIRISRKYSMYTILPVMEKRGKKFYNTALIIDRKEPKLTEKFQKLSFLHQLLRERKGIISVLV